MVLFNTIGAIFDIFMISPRYHWPVSIMQAMPPAQTIAQPTDEIMFKDLEKATINGFIGIGIHILAVPALILILAVTYVTAFTAFFGIILQIALAVLWFLQWNSYLIILSLIHISEPTRPY